MKPSASRVASRHLAGILEVPPRMFEDIKRWVRAQVAVNALVDKEALIANLRTYRTQPDVVARYAPLVEALAGIRAEPTSWKAYTALYDAMWVFGHPGTRLPVKEFQKLTPERATALSERMLALANRLAERMEGHMQVAEESANKELAEVARLKALAAEWPGIEPQKTGKITKKFPMDLRGWKYGEDQVAAGLAKRLPQWQEFLTQAPNPAAKTMIQDVISRMESSWNTVTVELVATSEVKGAAAFWREQSKLIQIQMPYAADDWQLDRMDGVLRHEMQHMAQSLLAWATGQDDMGVTLTRKPQPGFPSRHIMTPDYLQSLVPGRMDPASMPPEAKALLQRFRSQGINLHDLHSLDDIEFYTKLADTIDEVKRSITRAPELTSAEVREMLRYVSGQTREDAFIERIGYDKAKHFTLGSHWQFMRALKAAAPGKWRKAVAELTKAIL